MPSLDSGYAGECSDVAAREARPGDQSPRRPRLREGADSCVGCCRSLLVIAARIVPLPPVRKEVCLGIELLD